MSNSEDHPLVSVIIPTKDRRDLLLETLGSVQDQTYSQWEAMVVDDLSTDDTWSMLLDLAERDPRIRPLRRAGAIGGAPVARNQGFEASRGSFVVFLDSDDLLAPEALLRRVQMALAHPEADAVVFGGQYFRDTPGQYAQECAYSIRLLDGVDPLDAFLTSSSPWCTSGPLWRRAAIERVGPWDIEQPFLQDVDYHVRALIAGIRFQRFTDVDQYIRHHAGVRVSRDNNSDNVSSGLAFADRLISLLRAQDMLTARRKRMIAWSMLLGALTNAFERPLHEIRGALAMWRAAYDRDLAGMLAYLAGSVLVVLQWLKIFGPSPRELARLMLAVSLDRRPLLHPRMLRTIGDQLMCVFHRCRNRVRAQKAAQLRLSATAK